MSDLRSRLRAHESTAHVLAVLTAADKPLSAYEILDQVRPLGIGAPPSVYRALDRLIAEGRAHRIESLNAFVACCGGHDDAAVALAVCEGCGRVEEMVLPEMGAALAEASRKRGFAIARRSIELIGRCAACLAPTPAPAPAGAA